MLQGVDLVLVITALCLTTIVFFFLRHPLPSYIQVILDTLIYWYLFQQLVSRTLSSWDPQSTSIAAAVAVQIVTSVFNRCAQSPVIRALLPRINIVLLSFAVLYAAYLGFTDDLVLIAAAVLAVIIGVASWRWPLVDLTVYSLFLTYLVMYWVHSIIEGTQDPIQLLGDHLYLYGVWIPVALCRVTVVRCIQRHQLPEL
jgi:chromate transport protein ChrA